MRGHQGPHLVQLLLPLYDNDGKAFPRSMFADVRRELTERFGGATAYVRSPAVGEWKKDDGEVQKDDVLMVEVVVESLEAEFFRRYKEELKKRFRQEDLLIRALPCRTL